MAFLRPMMRLAMFATLLMALAPTISRTLDARSDGTGPVLMEMCTTAGLEVLDVSAFIGDVERPRPSMAMDDACGYCTLASLLLPILLLLYAALSWPAALLRPWRPAPFSRRLRNLRGLGAQAPPVAL